MGPRGNTGPQGPTGEPGATGPPGQAGTVAPMPTIGFTGPLSVDASGVQAVGSEAAAFFGPASDVYEFGGASLQGNTMQFPVAGLYEFRYSLIGSSAQTLTFTFALRAIAGPTIGTLMYTRYTFYPDNSTIMSCVVAVPDALSQYQLYNQFEPVVLSGGRISATFIGGLEY